MSPSSLSRAQASVIARLRRLHPDGMVCVHATRAGEIVEVRRGRRSEFARLLGSGELVPDERVSIARRRPARRLATLRR